MSEIFGGDASREMWDEINAIQYQEVQSALYTMGCKCQELEALVRSAAKPETSDRVVPKAYHEYHMGELRAERDKLAERVKELEEVSEKLAELESRCYDNGQPTGSSIFDEVEELRAFKVAIDAAATKLPEMPELVRDVRGYDLHSPRAMRDYATLLRSTAAAAIQERDALQVRVGELAEQGTQLQTSMGKLRGELANMEAERNNAQIKVIGRDNEILKLCAEIEPIDRQRKAALAEAEGLRRMVEEFPFDSTQAKHEALAAARRQGAEEERERLDEWIQHHPECPGLTFNAGLGNFNPCTCGLSEVMAPTENKEGK